MAGTIAKRLYGLSLKSRIAALVVACVLPTWLYVAYLSAESYERQRVALEGTLQATTRNLLRNVEVEITSAEAVVRALATSPYLESGDFQEFHARASALLRQTSGLNIVLLGPNGEQIVNTLKPYGEKLPTQPPPFFDRVRTADHPILSDLFVGPVAHQFLASLAIPIVREGRLVYVLALSLDEKTFAPLVHQKDRADSWVAGIFDTNGTIVARSHSPEKYVGTKGIQPVLDSLTGPPEGLIEANILEGTRVVLTHSRSERYGWTAVIAVPKDVLERDLNHSLRVSLVTGALVLLGGLVLARRLARDISTPIRALIPPAIAIGNGEKIALDPLDLKEAEEVRQALTAASELISTRTRERDAARTNELEISQRHKVLRALSDIAAFPNSNTSEQFAKALAIGRQHLDVSLGIISRIEGDTYTVLHHDSAPQIHLSNGQAFDLGQTYCALAMNANDVVAIAFMAETAFAGHPCYKAFGLETYIGAPIRVGDQLFGTVNFSSAAPRAHEFDAGDIEFMRLLARWVGSVIERDLANREILAARDAAEAAKSILALQAESLTQSNADLEQFAYVASHDLRTPLRNIMSYAQLLERRYTGKLDADADDFIGFIVDNSKKMSQLISDILEYSRSSRQTEPLLPISAENAVTQALGNLKSDMDLAGAEIRVEALPQVMAVEAHLVSLFQNLLGNAIKYRMPDRPSQISVGAERISAEFWQFTVADNGIGIDPAYHSKIFEMFQRLSPSAQEGTGIGLTLCRRIVHRFGGKIWVESEEGRGATFFFTLRAAFPPSR